MTYYGRWTYKYEEAARQGAAGVLIVHETKPASYGWTTVANSWSVPQFDIVRQNPSAERVPMEAWIQRDVAVDLFRHAGLDFEQEKIKARSRDFQPVELKGETFSAKYAVKTEVITSHNVAARLETMAEPGGICISSSVYDQITGKLDLGFQDIGNQTLKKSVLEMVAKIDVPSPETSSKINVYYLENTDATDLSKVLESVLKGSSATQAGSGRPDTG
jgi:hypothetical protein